MIHSYTHYDLYLFIVLDFMSNGAIVSVTGKDLNVIALETKEEEEETPQQLVECTRDDVFSTSVFSAPCHLPWPMAWMTILIFVVLDLFILEL